MRQEEQGAEAPYLEPKARGQSLFKRRKEERQYTGQSQLSLAITLNLKAMNNMPNFMILSSDITTVEEKLNALKIDNMIKVIGFAATSETSCQVLLVATPKQQGEELPMD